MIARPRIVCISQARMLSTRLPGKVMLPLEGRPLLQYQIERLSRPSHIDAICVATVASPECDPIVELCERLGTPVFRGDEQDVLSRFAMAAKGMDAEIVIRVTSDCPLLDVALIDKVIDDFLDGGNDLCALDIPKNYPRGLDCEVFSMENLLEADNNARSPYEREHVTPFIINRSERFKLNWRDDGHGGRYRFCVDTPDDYQLVGKIAAAFGPSLEFGWEDIVDFLDRHPDLAEINAHIRQKVE